MTHALVQNGTPGIAVAAPSPRPALIRPIAAPSEVLKVQEETRELIKQALKDGRDYGTIPGIDKPSLLKPGAERVTLAFGCTIQFAIVEKEVDHDREVRWIKTKWTEKPKPENHAELKARGIGRNKKYGERWVWQERSDEEGISLGLYRYVVMCELLHRESGQVVGSCLGSCSSMESKYIDRPRDCENTVIKMAEKRALVGAALTTFGLSEQFTQDVEDGPRADEGDADAPTAPRSSDPEPSCPKCGGAMWDNRLAKRSPKAPDFKCRSRSCDGVIWPPKPGEEESAAATVGDSSVDGDNGLNETALTLETALAVTLPGAKTAWGGKGGTPIGQLSPKMLESARRWTQGKIDEAGANGEEADPVKARLLRAIDLVLPFKKAEAERDQATMNLEATPSTAASPDPAAQSPTPSVTELARKIEAALKNAKFTDDERAGVRKRLEKAATAEELELVLDDVQTFLDEPF